MFKKSCIIFLCLVTFLILKPAILTASSGGQPKLNGTFIQEDLMKDWTDAQWQSEFQHLKDAGMSYVIIGAVAVNDPSGQYTMLTTYPTQIPGCAQKQGYQDLVDNCLRNAEAKGIKVFMGTNCRNDWFQHMANDPQWLYDRMNESNQIADELWTNYKSLYPNAFYGWYWCYEVDNLNYNTTTKRNTLANALNIVLDHLQASGQKLPFMMCPFMNAAVGTPAGYEDMWKYVFARTNFTAGDIFAPQDSVGAGGTDLSNVADWFAALKRAVDTKPGLKLWSDLETFDHTDWMAATIGRIYQQMDLEKPYVEDYVTFAYSHYQSPNNTDSGYHSSYLDYIANGIVETACPAKPINFTAKPLPTGGAFLDWDASVDNIGVCGYYIYRDGNIIGKLQMERKDKRSAMPGLATDYTDLSVSTSATYTYQVQAFDFAGNVSPVTQPIKVTAGPAKIFANNVAKGCTYVVNPVAGESYPDTGGVELTDGILAGSSDYSNSAWQGWYEYPGEVIVDLGSAKEVQQFIASCLNDKDLKIFLPSSMSVSVSTDGTNYTTAGNLAIPKNVSKNVYKLGLTLDNPINARYVKLTSIPGGHSWTGPCWTFIDEFEVRNSDYSDLPNLISKGCTYTVTPAAHSNYPDTGNKELTDGILSANTTYTNSEWQGWDAGTREIAIDLGSERLVQQVTGDFLNNPSYYMYTPDSATVWISNDNISYTQVGSLSGPTPPAGASKCKQYLTLDIPVSARYVKLIVTGGAWIFVDEIEVRNNYADIGSIISGNTAYTVLPGAHPNYPDTNNAELTDGNYSLTTSYKNTQWQGWDAGTREIVIDLGSERLIQQVTGDFLNNPSYYMYTPRSATVWVSDDGTNYSQIGSLNSDNPGSTVCKCKQYLTLETPIRTQYVKLIVTGGAWIFVDEIEVRI